MCKTVCNVLYRKINSERKFIMKKKFIAITLAVSAMMSTVAFAENINANYTDNAPLRHVLRFCLHRYMI